MLLPHDWLIRLLHECANVQLFQMKWTVSVLEMVRRNQAGVVSAKI